MLTMYVNCPHSTLNINIYQLYNCQGPTLLHIIHHKLESFSSLEVYLLLTEYAIFI